MPDVPNTSGPVFGPRPARPELPNPLGKMIRLRIKLEGCRDLPQAKASLQRSDSRPLYSVQEGVKSLRGTVQWNEVLYLECFESSFIQTGVYSSDGLFPDSVASGPVAQLLEIDNMSLWGNGLRNGFNCTLYLSTSQVFDGAEEQGHDSTRAQDDHLRAGPQLAHSAPAACITNSLHTILRQLLSLAEILAPLVEIASFDLRYGIYRIEDLTYIVYEHSLDLDSCHPRVNALVKSMASTMNVILPVVSTYGRQVAEYLLKIMTQLWWSALIMRDLVQIGESDDGDQNPEAELGRLTWIIVTPNPTIGAHSTSTSSNQRTISSTIAKDALLWALDALAQSSDACSPLKSVAGGLVFFATWADLVSSNKEEIRETCERINSLVTYFKLVIQDGAPLTTAHQNTINALAKDIAQLNNAVEEIVAERKSRLKRYISAKQHRKKLQGIARKLDEARGNYMVAVVTLHTSTTANVLAHVQAHSLIMGASPMYAPGTRRADQFTFPFSPALIEEA